MESEDLSKIKQFIISKISLGSSTLEFCTLLSKNWYTVWVLLI